MSNVVDIDYTKDMFGPKNAGHQIIVEGRAIPGLTGWVEGDEVFLCIDNRMTVPVRKQDAQQVAWFVANAMAVASGYAFVGAETKDRPFAPLVSGITI